MRDNKVTTLERILPVMTMQPIGRTMLSLVSKSFFNQAKVSSLRSSPVTSAIRWKSGAPSNPRGGKVTTSGALRYRGPYGKTYTAGGGSSKLPKKPIKPYKDAWNVVGYSTAESFDLVSLEQELASQVYTVLMIMIVRLQSALKNVC